MRRRDFITFLGGAGIALPFAARAQQAAMPVIGFLSSRAAGESTSLVGAFRNGLAEAGFFDGQHITLEFRWADGDYGRLPALAADLVRRQVAILVAVGGVVSVRAARAWSPR